MEELLNKLIEKGWKPRDIETLYTEVKHGTIHLILPQMGNLWKPIRLLVSKESGLWQFCVENKLVKTKDKKVRYRYEDLERTQNYFSWYGYEYRLIESALCDEEDLEKFLLENIKIS